MNRPQRVLRAGSVTAEPVSIQAVEALPYTMDGRPIAAEVKAAKDAGFRKGWDAGWTDGFAAGRVEGAARAHVEAHAAVVPAIDALDRALAALRSADQLTLGDIEAEVLGLAFEVARALVGRELTGEEAAADALRRSLALVPDRGDVVARLHPLDVEAIRDLDITLAGRELTIVADPDVERGGCLVDVGACRIDAQIGPAIERVRTALGLA